MDAKERVYAVLNGEAPDRVPQLIYSNHLPKGRFERRMRNLGLGLDVRCNVYRSYTPNVKTETRTAGDYLYATYTTPVGQVNSKRRVNLSFQMAGGTWAVERPVKNEKDIEVYKFIIEDTVYEPDFEGFRQNEVDLEGDGIVTASGDYTPLMHIITQCMGFRNFAIMFGRNPKAIESLIETLDKSFLELYRIIAESPAQIVRIGDNIDGQLISPKLFEKYCLPYYNKYAEILHKSGKKVISHMDGRLLTLKDLIAKTKLDAIEAFTPPPMGNLPVSEAKRAWKDKVVWMNFPEEVFLRTAKEIRAYTMALLKEMTPGNGYIVGITEDIHPQHLRKGIGNLTKTIHKYGKLPLCF